jgi:hypothetical protein
MHLARDELAIAIFDDADQGKRQIQALPGDNRHLHGPTIGAAENSQESRWNRYLEKMICRSSATLGVFPNSALMRQMFSGGAT